MIATGMRLALSMASALVVGGAVTVGWLLLSAHEVQHYAELSEAESYATRSHLVREVDTQLKALREVATFWSRYGHLPKDQWDQDAQIELGHFEGIDTILWNDAQRGIRYVTSAEDLVYDRRPTDEQWETLQNLLEGVHSSGEAVLLGPSLDEDGHQTYRVQIPATGPGASGVLVAQVDAFEQLRGLLRDRSPGHSISVWWNDAALYERGEPAPDIPVDWVRDGLIELSMGPLWKVVHAPTPDLAASFTRPAVPGLLATGWIIAALVGFLVYQNGRVRERAIAAERAEAENWKLNVELEQKVEQRTRELAERTADLETITESVSHDLRNPMNSIALCAELLRAQPGDQATVLTVVERVERAKNQVMDVLDRLRHFSEVSFIEFNREEIDIEALAKDICRELSELEPPPVPQVEVGPLPACGAHRTLLRILLINLVSNALKYTRGHSERRIEVGYAEGSGYFVRDNGRGFEPAKAPEMFEPFRRFSDDGDGWGVGLAIVARIVHRHGGEVRAEGAPGVGATFYFHLGDTIAEAAAETGSQVEDDGAEQRQPTTSMN